MEIIKLGINDWEIKGRLGIVAQKAIAAKESGMKVKWEMN